MCGNITVENFIQFYVCICLLYNIMCAQVEEDSSGEDEKEEKEKEEGEGGGIPVTAAMVKNWVSAITEVYTRSR